MPIGLIAAGVVALMFLGLGAYAKIEHSGKLEAQAQVAERDAKIEQQNQAVAQLKLDSDRKAAEGAKALSKAEGRAKVWTDNALRLQSILASRKPTDAKDCKSAWADIRKP